MKKKIYKPAKVTLCRECGGSGRIDGDVPVVCPQCEGSGRVMVSGVMEIDIQPYKPKK
jgi:DnaJ-class molecular chaperone